ncbi:MAG: nucleotide exchange factor GrpE [Betaproteobacteria bacterium]|nr:MAG: nucleotide exchange factor GrpE [Betaproteobacteria bacterium]
MSTNSDQKTQVSAEIESSVPIPSEAGPVAAKQASAADPAPDLGDLLRKAEDEAAGLKDAWLRARAETENVRRQAQNDVAKAYKYAIERFAQELLTVKDALELTLATPASTNDTLKDGVELTLKNLKAAFDKSQISEIDPLNEKYDPHRHQAMTMLESDQPAGTVVQVFQKGYLLNDRVLRPALVAVAKAREGAASGQAGA